MMEHISLRCNCDEVAICFIFQTKFPTFQQISLYFEFPSFFSSHFVNTEAECFRLHNAWNKSHTNLMQINDFDVLLKATHDNIKAAQVISATQKWHGNVPLSSFHIQPYFYLNFSKLFLHLYSFSRNETAFACARYSVIRNAMYQISDFNRKCFQLKIYRTKKSLLCCKNMREIPTASTVYHFFCSNCDDNCTWR